MNKFKANTAHEYFGLKFIECTCTKMYEKPLMIIEAWILHSRPKLWYWVHGMFILSRVCSFFFFFFFNHVGLFGGDISFFNHDMFMIWLIFHLLDSINVIKGFLEDKSKKSLEIVFFFKIYKFMVYYSLFIFSMPKWDLWLEMLRIIVYQEFDSFLYIYITRGFVFYFLWDKKNRMKNYLH